MVWRDLVGTLKISLDRLEKKSLLVKASLRLEAAERPQGSRLCLLSRPRSRGHVLSLVGDRGQVL